MHKTDKDLVSFFIWLIQNDKVFLIKRTLKSYTCLFSAYFFLFYTTNEFSSSARCARACPTIFLSKSSDCYLSSSQNDVFYARWYGIANTLFSLVLWRLPKSVCECAFVCVVKISRKHREPTQLIRYSIHTKTRSTSKQ